MSRPRASLARLRLVIGLAALALLQTPIAVWPQDVGRARRSVRVGNLLYRGSVRVVIDTLRVAAPEPIVATRLRTTVTVTNVGRRPVALRWWPNCPFTSIELWPATHGKRSRAGDQRLPAWDEQRWWLEYERVRGIAIECDFAGAPPQREIAPGASATFDFERHAPRPKVSEVLGDSLRPGRYRVVLRVRPHTGARDAPMGVRLAAGEVRLAVGSRR